MTDSGEGASSRRDHGRQGAGNRLFCGANFALRRRAKARHLQR